jgi:hypothetical protein
MVIDERVRNDPGNIWLRSLIAQRADEMKNEKIELYKENLQLFA